LLFRGSAVNKGNSAHDVTCDRKTYAAATGAQRYGVAAIQKFIPFHAKGEEKTGVCPHLHFPQLDTRTARRYMTSMPIMVHERKRIAKKQIHLCFCYCYFLFCGERNDFTI
jgi:hypothetical protein